MKLDYYYLIILCLSCFSFSLKIGNVGYSEEDFSSTLDNINRDTIEIYVWNMPSRRNLDILKMSQEMEKQAEKYHMTDIEKAYMIYFWMRQNEFEMDCQIYNQTSEQLAQTVYNKGKGTSYGIASLFQFFANYLHLNAGFIKGYLRTPNQGLYDLYKLTNIKNTIWNYIEIDGIYYLVDVSISRGYCIDMMFYTSFSNLYFATNPKYFLYTHFPDESEWQLLANPISRDEFESKAVIYSVFYEKGFYTIFPDTSTYNDKIVNITITYNQKAMDYFKYYITGILRDKNNQREFIDFKNKTYSGKIDLTYEIQNKDAIILTLIATNTRFIPIENTLASYTLNFDQ